MIGILLKLDYQYYYLYTLTFNLIALFINRPKMIKEIHRPATFDSLSEFSDESIIANGNPLLVFGNDAHVQRRFLAPVAHSCQSFESMEHHSDLHETFLITAFLIIEYYTNLEKRNRPSNQTEGHRVSVKKILTGYCCCHHT